MLNQSRLVLGWVGGCPVHGPDRAHICLYTLLTSLYFRVGGGQLASVSEHVHMSRLCFHSVCPSDSTVSHVCVCVCFCMCVFCFYIAAAIAVAAATATIVATAGSHVPSPSPVLSPSVHPVPSTHPRLEGEKSEPSAVKGVSTGTRSSITEGVFCLIYEVVCDIFILLQIRGRVGVGVRSPVRWPLTAETRFNPLLFPLSPPSFCCFLGSFCPRSHSL